MDSIADFKGRYFKIEANGNSARCSALTAHWTIHVLEASVGKTKRKKRPIDSVAILEIVKVVYHLPIKLEVRQAIASLAECSASGRRGKVLYFTLANSEQLLGMHADRNYLSD